MSASATFNFNDDGTVTMVHRPDKASDVKETVMGPFTPRRIGIVNVHGGDNDDVTHQIMIGDVATMNRLRELGWVRTKKTEEDSLSQAISDSLFGWRSS